MSGIIDFSLNNRFLVLVLWLMVVAATHFLFDGFVVFQATGPGEYKLVPVLVLGRSREFAEVTGAIFIGDAVAIGDTFVLKSEAGKEEMGGGHSH